MAEAKDVMEFCWMLNVVVHKVLLGWVEAGEEGVVVTDCFEDGVGSPDAGWSIIGSSPSVADAGGTNMFVFGGVGWGKGELEGGDDGGNLVRLEVGVDVGVCIVEVDFCGSTCFDVVEEELEGKVDA